MKRAGAALAPQQRAVIYARRSTDHQEGSIDVQTAEAQKYIDAMGWKLQEVYVDDAISRAEYKKRPSLYGMLNGAERGDFDVIVMRDVDRLGGDTNRNGVILSDLIDKGVRVDEYLTKNTVKLDNAIAKFLAMAKNFAAEIEREKTSQRTHEALQVKATKGYNVGGKCFGYDNRKVYEGEKHVRTEYVKNEEQAAVVREIFEMFVKGMGNRAIAKELNKRGVSPPRAGKRGTGSWSPSVIWHIVHNERYRGVIRYGKYKKGYREGTKVRTRRSEGEILRLERPELRIISEELWAAVQQRIVKHTTPWQGVRGRKPRFLLTGLARCSECGGGIKVKTSRSGTTPTPMYVCGYHDDRGSAVCKNSLRRPVDEIDIKLLELVQASFRQEKFITKVLAEVRRRLAKQAQTQGVEVDQIEAQATRLRKEIGNLSQGIAIAKGVSLPSLVDLLSARQAELTKLEARLAVTKAAPGVLDLECRRLERDVLERIANLRDVLEHNPQRAREALEALLADKLTFTPVPTDAGRGYEVEGRLAAGGILHLPATPRMIASPGGFEPPLAT
jgi:site-specific DNA recombinase